MEEAIFQNDVNFLLSWELELQTQLQTQQLQTQLQKEHYEKEVAQLQTQNGNLRDLNAKLAQRSRPGDQGSSGEGTIRGGVQSS